MPLEVALSAASGLGWALYLSGLWAIGDTLQPRYRLVLLLSGLVLARTLFQLVNGLETSLALGLLTWTCSGLQRPRAAALAGFPRRNLAVPSARVRRVFSRGRDSGALAPRFVLPRRRCADCGGVDGSDPRGRRRDTADDHRGQTSVFCGASAAVAGDVGQGTAGCGSRVRPRPFRPRGVLAPSDLTSVGGSQPQAWWPCACTFRS